MRHPRPLPKIDFLQPAGAAALYAPDSLTWQIYKNPVSLFIGGITAVLLELGEERVRSGVWNHSVFPTDPLTRMRRTGLAAHVSVYAPVPTAEKLIGAVVRMHGRVEGHTPRGTPYRANDPELLNWVQCTASCGNRRRPRDCSSQAALPPPCKSSASNSKRCGRTWSRIRSSSSSSIS